MTFFQCTFQDSCADLRSIHLLGKLLYEIRKGKCDRLMECRQNATLIWQVWLGPYQGGTRERRFILGSHKGDKMSSTVPCTTKSLQLVIVEPPPLPLTVSMQPYQRVSTKRQFHTVPPSAIPALVLRTVPSISTLHGSQTTNFVSVERLSLYEPMYVLREKV